MVSERTPKYVYQHTVIQAIDEHRLLSLDFQEADM